MPALRDYARGQLSIAEGRSLRRRLVETERIGSGRVRRGGKEYVSFSCNDYMGLTHHPEVIAAAREAMERHGIGAGASRLVTGSHPLYAQLESLLAEMKGTERRARLQQRIHGECRDHTGPRRSGRPHRCRPTLSRLLVGRGAALGATVHRFDHNDVGHCRELLEANRGAFERCLILTETVFSMDGDRGPVEELGELAREFDAWLMTDDAHGLGVCPSTPADVQMGTLSKAAGGLGGYVCGSTELIAWLENRSRSLMFSTGLPPASVAGAAAALRIIRDDPDLRVRPLANARRFAAALGRPPAESPIVPVILGEPERALAASAMLEKYGLLVVAIRPPSVPPGTARLRFAFSALHEPEPIDRAAALLKEHQYV